MAPKRKRGDAAPATPTRVTRSAVKASTRATRSAIARGDAILHSSVDNPEPSKRRKTASPAPAPAPAPAEGPAVTIIIEHGKETRAFETRATKIKKGLKKSVPGMKVVVNPEGPKEGSFVIREEGGEEFLSLLNMEKPFQELKDLEIDKVVSDITEKLNR